MTADQKLTITLTRDEKVDTKNGGLSLLRKQQFSLSLQEIEVLKKYLTLLEFFQLYHVYTNDAIQKNSTSSLLSFSHELAKSAGMMILTYQEY